MISGRDKMMKKTAIMTDSNSGITPVEGDALGISVIPMPFYINEKLYFEDITLSQEGFYEVLKDETVSISTSMPSLGDIADTWDKLLKDNDEVVFIPMSEGLSSACAATTALAEDEYAGKVFVVNNRRISVTQRRSVLDAKYLADNGCDGSNIKEELERSGPLSSIYIMVDTLKYLKKGGRVTSAAAAIGTVLKIKPVLQIHGDKLDAFALAKSTKRAKELMLSAIEHDIEARLGVKDIEKDVWIDVAYSGNMEDGQIWLEEVREKYPGNEIIMNPLSLSVACHIGPGSLAVTCTRKLAMN